MTRQKPEPGGPEICPLLSPRDCEVPWPADLSGRLTRQNDTPQGILGKYPWLVKQTRGWEKCFLSKGEEASMDATSALKSIEVGRLDLRLVWTTQ